jgi:hypothetical protein
MLTLPRHASTRNDPAIHERFLDETQPGRKDFEWMCQNYGYPDALDFIGVAENGGFYVWRIDAA